MINKKEKGGLSDLKNFKTCDYRFKNGGYRGAKEVSQQIKLVESSKLYGYTTVYR